MSALGKARRWGYRCLLAVELALVVLLVLGGCYSKQNYQVLAPQSGDERLSKCNVVVEGRIVYVHRRNLTRWQEPLAYCWPFAGEEKPGPTRYDISIAIDTILKGDPTMPRRLRVDNCRPLSPDENTLFSQLSDNFPENVRVRIGFNRQSGRSFHNLIIVPLGSVPTTQPR